MPPPSGYAYHQRRAEQEVLAAAQATDSAVVAAHYNLSCLHLDALEGGVSDEPGGASANGARHAGDTDPSARFVGRETSKLG